MYQHQNICLFKSSEMFHKIIILNERTTMKSFGSKLFNSIIQALICMKTNKLFLVCFSFLFSAKKTFNVDETTSN